MKYGESSFDILLSFAFYIPVAVGAGAVPMLGMLMLPKTVCYILMTAAFLKAQSEGTAADRRNGAGKKE